MIAVQRRSGKRHLIHPDGLATRCGRIIRRTNWRLTEESGGSDCESCKAALRAELLGEGLPMAELSPLGWAAR